MSLLTYIRRLQFIDFLIKRKATGDLQTFANKNSLSKSHMELVLKEMKGLGFPLKYSRILHTYYYEKEGEMTKSLFVLGSALSREEMKKIKLENINDINNLCYSEKTIFKPCVEKRKNSSC